MCPSRRKASARSPSRGRATRTSPPSRPTRLRRPSTSGDSTLTQLSSARPAVSRRRATRPSLVVRSRLAGSSSQVVQWRSPRSGTTTKSSWERWTMTRVFGLSSSRLGSTSLPSPRAAMTPRFSALSGYLTPRPSPFVSVPNPSELQASPLSSLQKPIYSQ